MTPAGAPAVGVKVLIEDFRDSDSWLEGERVYGGRYGQYDDDHRLEYWPVAWTTDKDGRFRIEAIVPEKMLAHLHFRHPDFADDDLFVSTGLPCQRLVPRSQARRAEVHPHLGAGPARDGGRH